MQKKLVTLTLIFGAVFCVGTPGVAATATNTLTVTSTVIPKCTISASTLAFGNYDPVVTNAASPLTQSATISFTCTTGASGTIDIDKGANSTGTTPNFQRRMTDGSSHYLSYDLYQDSGRTTLWGATTGGTAEAYSGTGTAGQSATLYGSVPAAQNVSTGSYSDTATMTITF